MRVRYLTLELVLKLIVAPSGWALKDPGLLDSALKRPQTTVFGQDAYPGIAQKAAAMMYSIAQNQALVDGNKRLALRCTGVFLRINGMRMGADHDDMFQMLDLDIPQGLNDVAEIARRLDVQTLHS